MNIKSIKDLLKVNTFFSELPDDDLELIAGCGANRFYEADKTIAREGDPANHFFVVREGKIAIETHTPGGEFRLQTLGKGDVAGWSWLFPPHSWHYDVITLEPTHVLCLEATCIRAKCESNHSMGYRLIKLFARLIVERNRALRLQVMDVYGNTEAR